MRSTLGQRSTQPSLVFQPFGSVSKFAGSKRIEAAVSSSLVLSGTCHSDTCLCCILRAVEFN